MRSRQDFKLYSGATDHLVSRDTQGCPLFDLFSFKNADRESE
jgi:hypothetical protein